MHYSGIGTAADKWKAHAFYARAADAGDAEALNALGAYATERATASAGSVLGC